MIAEEYGICHYFFFFPRAVEVGTESQKTLTYFFGFVKEIKKSVFFVQDPDKHRVELRSHKKGRHEGFSSLPGKATGFSIH